MIDKRLNILYLYDSDFQKVWSIQQELREKRIAGEIADCLLLVTHPHVLTLGKRGRYENILVPIDTLSEKGITVYEIERGGDITYHGPGQLVIYPIIDLTAYQRDLRGFVSKLQQAVLSLLCHDLSIQAHAEDGIHTGVWVGNNKIAAIGLSLRKWVTMHGMALNINTDLSYFDLIVPCGLSDRGVTSIKMIKGETIDFEMVTSLFIHYFCQEMGCRPVMTDLEHVNGTKT